MRYLLLLVLLVPVLVFSQGDSVKTVYPTFKLGFFYNNHVHYYGRTDSLKSSAFFPVAELWANKNFYFSAIPVFISNQTGTNYGGSVFTAGARFQEEKKFIAHV